MIPVNNCPDQVNQTQLLEVENEKVNYNERNVVRNEGSHWSLLVLEKASMTFFYYDSIRGINSSVAKCLAKKLNSYLTKQNLNEKLSFVETSCPQQQNTNDCGVYMK